MIGPRLHFDSGWIMSLALLLWMTSGMVAQLRTSNLVGARCRVWTMVFNMCDHTLHANAGMHQLRGDACISRHGTLICQQLAILQSMQLSADILT